MNLMRQQYSRKSRKGSSLAIVLMLIAILTVLIVSTMLLVSFETRQANSVLDSQRAKNVAQLAVDEVAEKLASIPLDKHWAAAPGLIRYWNGSTWNNTIELYSGNSSAQNEQVNLNAKLADGTHTIIPANQEFSTGPEMNVDWIYLLKDGSLTKGPLSANQIPVGRFAYWTDLENARVNINTAGFGMTKFAYHLQNTPANTIASTSPDNYPNLVFASNPWMTDRVDLSGDTPVFSSLDRSAAQSKTPQNLVGHPSSIDLSHLEGISEEQSFNTFRYAGSYFLRVDAKNTYSLPDSRYTPSQEPDISVRFFNTPADWKLIVGEDSYQKNKAYITTLGRSPEITPWGFTKIPLSLVSKDGFALNELTETFYRNIPTRGDNEPAYFQDTRRVQVPAMVPVMSKTSTAGRTLFRDLSSVPSPMGIGHNRFAIADLGRDLSSLFAVPFPGYANSLASKYNTGSPGESDQVAIELMGHVARSTNAMAGPAGAPFLPSNPNNGLMHFAGLDAPMLKSSTVRRTASGGPLLINELVLQAEPVPYTALIDQVYNYFGVAGLNAGGDSFNPKPKAVCTSEASNYLYMFLARDYDTTDYFIKVVLKAELMTSANSGLLTTPLPGKSLGDSFYIFTSNVECKWTSNDPLSGSGTLYFDYANETATPDFFRRLQFSLMDPGFAFLSRPTTGMAYVQTPTPTKGRCFIVGPFAKGTVVSSLKFRFRILAQTQSEYGPAWSKIPGIFDDFNVTETSPPNAAALAGTFLEFGFTNIDTTSPIPQYSSMEINDPRVSRRKTDWKASPSNTHTLGTQNSIFNGTGVVGDASDLSFPNSLLQVVRGRLRRARGLPDAQSGRIEEQTSSRILGLPGVGYLSSVPTGVDAGIPWKTMQFHKTADSPPDWLLWNLFYVPFDRSMLNQTDGKLNINTTLHPFGIKRIKPLEALIGNRVSNPSTLANSIAAGPNSSGLPSDLYVYTGQICDVPGLADSGADEYIKEALPRDLADLVTTQCSDYRVFIVAQALKKTPLGTIVPTATHRAEVTLSRTVDAGAQTYSFGELDGPLPEVFLRSAYESAGLNATRTKLDDIKGTIRSPLGVDRIPNTGDDWLLPQRIDITSYRTLQ
ncbi:MAG: hypothetical protein WCQ57_01620 [Verrucomicrobiota bacterium]